MSQHDMNIANQGFPNFRSDLNNALAALVSTSSGATAPSTTFAHQMWVDTSANPSVLKIRNADNDAWISVADLNQTSDSVTKIYGVSGVDNLFTVAQTFRASNAIRSEAASTQDAVVIAGRAGGTSSYAVTMTPTTLSANRTLTLPNVTDTVATIGTAQTFTAAQTFRAADAIRSEAASTQDAVVLAGRAGGTSSYAVTITPATLSASRTATLPDGGGNYTIGYRNAPAVGTKTGSYTLAVADIGKYVQVGSGGSITIPDATFAEGDVISIFNNTSAGITITCSITTAYIAGTDSDKASVTLATRGVATVLFISSTVCVITGNVS